MLECIDLFFNTNAQGSHDLLDPVNQQSYQMMQSYTSPDHAECDWPDSHACRIQEHAFRSQIGNENWTYPI